MLTYAANIVPNRSLPNGQTIALKYVIIDNDRGYHSLFSRTRKHFPCDVFRDAIGYVE